MRPEDKPTPPDRQETELDPKPLVGFNSLLAKRDRAWTHMQDHPESADAQADWELADDNLHSYVTRILGLAASAAAPCAECARLREDRARLDWLFANLRTWPGGTYTTHVEAWLPGRLFNQSPITREFLDAAMRAALRAPSTQREE